MGNLHSRSGFAVGDLGLTVCLTPRGNQEGHRMRSAVASRGPDVVEPNDPSAHSVM